MHWQLRDGVSWARTEYGGVLLDAGSGEYWTLNRTGAVVLTCLLDGAPEGVAVQQLTAEFDADAGTVAHDVPELVAQLTGSGLVVRR